jgi:hypothetical protein
MIPDFLTSMNYAHEICFSKAQVIADASLNILDQVTGSSVPANISIAHHVTSPSNVPLPQFFD